MQCLAATTHQAGDLGAEEVRPFAQWQLEFRRTVILVPHFPFQKPSAIHAFILRDPDSSFFAISIIRTGATPLLSVTAVPYWVVV